MNILRRYEGTKPGGRIEPVSNLNDQLSKRNSDIKPISNPKKIPNLIKHHIVRHTKDVSLGDTADRIRQTCYW